MGEKWFDDYVEQVNLNNKEEAVKVLLDHIPNDKMIYKYCKGLQRNMDNLCKQQLWLSNVFQFNDPYD